MFLINFESFNNVVWGFRKSENVWECLKFLGYLEEIEKTLNIFLRMFEHAFEYVEVFSNVSKSTTWPNTRSQVFLDIQSPKRSYQAHSNVSLEYSANLRQKYGKQTNRKTDSQLEQIQWCWSIQ